MKPSFSKSNKKTAVGSLAFDQKLKSVFSKGLSSHQAGRLEEAQKAYEDALKINPAHFDSLHLLGVIAVQKKDFASGLARIDQAIAVNATVAVAHTNRALALRGLGHLHEAIASYAKALELNPDDAETYNAHAILLNDNKQYEEADRSFLSALRINPLHAEAFNNRGILLHTMAQLAEHANKAEGLQHASLECFDNAIALNHGYAEAHNNRGNVLRALGDPVRALESVDQAIALKPMFAAAFNSRGNVLRELKRYAEAVASFDRAIDINPAYAEAHSNRANVLSQMGQHEAARESYQQALALQPDSAEVLNNHGNTFLSLKKPYAALEAYNQALKLKPDYAEAFHNCGNVFRLLRQIPVALAHYQEALKLKPDFADALANQGLTFKELGNLELAVESLDKALALEPGNVAWLTEKGHLLVKLGRRLEALASYEAAYALAPGHTYLFGTLVHLRGQICDWESAEAEQQEVVRQVMAGDQCIVPFALLASTSDPRVQLAGARNWIKHQDPADDSLGPIEKRVPKGKIRVGYFSADFRKHPVSYLTAELFERHDRERFEVIGFSLGPDSDDPMRRRLVNAFDQFIDIDAKTGRDIAVLARDMGIDIAVDLTGHTAGARTELFAYRAAPIQVNYLGHPGTIGADYIDYLIADATVVPPAMRAFYAEKMMYLPSFQVNDSTRAIADKVYSREELGLPAEGFVFCCFNNNYKITPGLFEGWARILKSVPGSVLYVYGGNEQSMVNLKKEAASRDLADRLFFGANLPLEQHLARYRACDLFLDTLPFNAGTTASDALWAGLPVLTCMGEAFASRMAASLLNAMELPELVTTSQAAYEAAAIELALDQDKYQQLRAKVAANRLTTSLFDTVQFTRNLENVYEQAYAALCEGRTTEHLFAPGVQDGPSVGL